MPNHVFEHNNSKDAFYFVPLCLKTSIPKEKDYATQDQRNIIRVTASSHQGDDGNALLYAQPVITRKYDLKDIDDFCAKYRHTSRGEIQRLFRLLEEVTTMWLRDGNRVETPFGSFAPKLKLIGEHTDPTKVTSRDIMYGGIEFIPSKQFVKDADCSHEGFRRKKSVVGNSQMYDAKAMEEALRRSTHNGYITISTFMVFSHLKRKSAKAYLDSLCEGQNPQLQRYREGRTLHYTVLKNTPTL